MLDKDVLSQLKQLKQQIKDSKEYVKGQVKSTQGKFGFVVTDDKREIYLSPEEMQKVFPGDTVKVLVIREEAAQQTEKKAAEKTSGKIEKLIDSPLKDFAGRYVVKGKGHFVEPDLPRFSRWIFVPPTARNGARDGDYVYCSLSRHPFPQAKPQAKVLGVIGPDSKAGIEADYTIAKFQLNPPWPQSWQQDIASIDLAHRSDLTQIPFITIDAASTLDMDDALYASKTENGWQLLVAIADPSALIKENSPLDIAARQRATSIYLPGRAVAMLPDALANEQCSLLPQQQRPALVCKLNILADGGIDTLEFTEAIICSQAKLSYQQVAAFLDTGEGDADSQAHSDNLTALHQLSQALLAYRTQHNLVIPSRQDYRLVLNEQKKLQRVEPQLKTSAHQLVEECMIAANRSAAEYLGDSGLFIEHPGFRPERLADVKKLAEEQLGLTGIDFDTPQGYQQLMKAIDDDTLEFPLRAVLSRLLERSRLSTAPKPHQGMGLACYTTITSPIRKYSDLLAHRLIKAKLSEAPAPALEETLLDTLQQRQDNARQAGYQMEQWLKCQYMEPLVGQRFSGVVTQVNSNGFSVRIEPHLIEGFVENKSLEQKYSFDPMRLLLKSGDNCIGLNQQVTVTVKAVDSKLRSIRLNLEQAQEVAPPSCEG